jgi:diguanylate cyclase (GGDEF)-like protein
MAGIDIAVVLVAAGVVGWLGWRWLVAWREARRRALRDQLTGLMNDRAFAMRVGDGLEGGREASGEMALLMYDIDGLGAISERFGREFGDFVLRLFAEKAKAEIREDDLLFRLGDDEFCSILPATSEEDARAIAERIRAAFSEKKLRAARKQNVRPTVSVGLASSAELGFSIDRLKSAAEAALAEAKRAGRNRLEIYRAPAVEERSAA